MRRANRKDANHGEISDHIRSLGWSVLDLAQHGLSVDLAVGRPGMAALVEIKDGSKPESERRLTEKEIALRKNWEGPYLVVTSPEDAEGQLNALAGSP